LFDNEQKYYKNELTKVNIYQEQLLHHDSNKAVGEFTGDLLTDEIDDISSIICAATAKAAEDLLLLQNDVSDAADKKCLQLQ